MPACVIGGVSLVLYGMISAVGIRNLVENHVDFTRSRNVLITAIVLVLSLGIAYSASGAVTIVVAGVTIGFSGLAVGSVAGILLNVVLPDDGAPTAAAVEELAAQPASRPLKRGEAVAAGEGALADEAAAAGVASSGAVAGTEAGVVAAGGEAAPAASEDGAPRALEDELENERIG